MTKVDECTRAEIGVGADIANGNQKEKGYKALFVIKVNKSNSARKLGSECDNVIKFNLSENMKQTTILMIKKQSPIRFINKV